MEKRYKRIVVEESFFNKIKKFLKGKMSPYKYFEFLHDRNIKENVITKNKK